MAQQFELDQKTTRRIGLFIILCILAVIGGATVKLLQWMF